MASIRSTVTPQQLEVGFESGVQVKIWGLRLLQERSELSGTSFVILKKDRVNAHNAFYRPEAVETIREAAEADPSLKPFARLTDSIFRLEPQINTRKTTLAEGIRPLCTSQRGGAQGNATTSSIYPAAMNNTLKTAERTGNVTIRAIQDDATTTGDPTDIFGPGKSRDVLNKGFAACGNETRPEKSVAYCTRQQDRGQVPADVDQPSFAITDIETPVTCGLRPCHQLPLRNGRIHPCR
jgi:hypothetical protein